MRALVFIELQKIFSRPRSYIGLVAIVVITGLIQLALWLDGEEYLQFITGPVSAGFNLEGKVLNGYLVCFIILQTLIIQIPLLVALVTGDLISGESAMGTLRLLVTRPVSRKQIILAKFLSGAIYTCVLLLLLGLLSLGLSLVIFGPGDLIVLRSEYLTILPSSDLLWRFFGAFGLALLSLLVVGSFALLLSCYADNSIGPIISCMAVIILFTIIGTLDIPLFDRLKPFLFTTHMIIWRNMFDLPLEPSLLLRSILVLLFHLVLFLGIALYTFDRKDLLR